MGIGLSTIGFLLLHFHFLNNRSDMIQFIPLSISLTIIILGLLYLYHYTHQKNCLFLVGLNCLLIIISFMEHIRPAYLFLQTISFFLYIFVIKKETSLEKNKRLCFLLFLYLVFGILKAMTSLDGLVHNYFINHYSSILLLITCVFICCYSVKIMREKQRESRPRISPTKRPSIFTLGMIIICMLLFISLLNPLVEYSYNQSRRFHAYQLETDQLNIQYLITATRNPRSQYFEDTHQPFHVELKNGIKPQMMKLYFNDTLLSAGTFEYNKDNEYLYIENERHPYPSLLLSKQTYTVELDHQKYTAQIQPVELDEYKYYDQDISISRCFIKDNYIYSFPRVIINNPHVILETVEIVDSRYQVVASLDNIHQLQFSADGKTVCLESMNVFQTNQSQKPYMFVITYKDKNQHIRKEYPLTHENPLP